MVVAVDLCEYNRKIDAEAIISNLLSTYLHNVFSVTVDFCAVWICAWRSKIGRECEWSSEKERKIEKTKESVCSDTLRCYHWCLRAYMHVFLKRRNYYKCGFVRWRRCGWWFRLWSWCFCRLDDYAAYNSAQKAISLCLLFTVWFSISLPLYPHLSKQK